MNVLIDQKFQCVEKYRKFFRTIYCFALFMRIVNFANWCMCNFVSYMFFWLQELPFWKQCLTLGIWGKITLYKYISCWLISEGVCIIAGLTYNGKDSSGKHQWDGCANVKLRVFEGASKFGHYIASFNINTNHWVAQSVNLF